MSSFKFYYIQSCETLKVTPNKKVIQNIEQSSSSNVLDLASIQLTDETCRSLGQALSNDVFLQELDLSNCTLSDNGVSSILSGLEKNKCLKRLVLKGNNIKSLGAEAIGKFLRHNCHLESLFLEWNSISIFPAKFEYFCEGLSFNKSLKVLDLRNNQINYLCAQILANALSRNSALQEIDLRWNSIGLLGGRAFLKALSKNKSIIKLDMSHSDVPIEVLKALDIAISAAGERFITNNENKEKAQYFATKLQELESDKNIQLRTLMEQLDKKDKDISYNQKWNSIKCTELQEALQERDNTIEDLTRKLNDMEKKLSNVLEENNSVKFALTESDTKLKESRKGYQHLLEKERQDREETEKNLLKELGSLKEENMCIKQQVQDYKVAQVRSDDEILNLKNSVLTLEKKLKLQEHSHEEQISFLNEKHQKSLEENEKFRIHEVTRIQDEFCHTEKKLGLRIIQLENGKNELEKVIVEKNSHLLEIETQKEESIEELQKKMKDNEDMLKKQMEEEINKLKSTIKKRDESLKEQVDMVHEIKKKCTESDLLLAEEAHHNQQLQKNLEAKDAEMEASIAKVKLEVKEQLEELVKVKDMLKDSVAENKALLEKIEELKKQNVSEMMKKDEETKMLMEKLDEVRKVVNSRT